MFAECEHFGAIQLTVLLHVTGTVGHCIALLEPDFIPLGLRYSQSGPYFSLLVRMNLFRPILLRADFLFQSYDLSRIASHFRATKFPLLTLKIAARLPHGIASLFLNRVDLCGLFDV